MKVISLRFWDHIANSDRRVRAQDPGSTPSLLSLTTFRACLLGPGTKTLWFTNRSYSFPPRSLQKHYYHETHNGAATPERMEIVSSTSWQFRLSGCRNCQSSSRLCEEYHAPNDTYQYQAPSSLRLRSCPCCAKEELVRDSRKCICGVARTVAYRREAGTQAAKLTRHTRVPGTDMTGGIWQGMANLPYCLIWSSVMY